MAYDETLNLPVTDFAMKASLPEKEPNILKKWEKEKTYEKMLEVNKNNKSFILHDGPPYANGDIHMGHALNKILKDIVLRYKVLTGHYVPYVPGWDTHGLPIEQQAIKKLGINREAVGPVKFREACRDFAIGYVNRQKEEFKRLGVMGDWDNPYLTLTPEFEAKQVEIFGEMAKKGYIYKGLKPVYWCADCETALAEAEIEYADDKTTSIYVKFAINDDKGIFGDLKEKYNIYFVIWTTTTWTLPGNLAICLNADFEYSLVRSGNDVFVVASELVDNLMKVGNIEDYEVIAKFMGKDLELMTCKHPFMDRDSLVIVGEHVTLDAGTGCVHTAPGHGQEDFDVCRNYPQIKMVVPVDAKGYLNEEAGQFKGLFYEKANAAIIENLMESEALFTAQEISHQYPHCWRCKQPIVYRATEQWFASIKGFRDRALEEIKTVNWIPTWGEERITNMVRDRGDWCISRQRIWGVPIPIFYCEDCGKELINDNTINSVKELFKAKGSNAWYELSPEEILKPETKCSCGGHKFKKETDIMDVWFDSGSSHASVLQTRDNLSWPADMYLEGNDQYRGWFQSSLLTSIAAYDKAPYKTVLTHGFVVDGEGRKMSKSLGNGVDPLEVIKQYGADILRLWVVSSDYKTDIRVSNDIIKQLTESYRKIRNTARFILGNISDFTPETDSVPYAYMTEIDKYVLGKLNKLVERVTSAYESYDYHVVFHSIHSFCVVDMSNLYLDIIKDRLYTSKKKSIERRSAQTAMYEILNALVKLLTPAIVFTAEEIWSFMPHTKSENAESIMLNKWPVQKKEYDNVALEEKWNKIMDLKADVSKVLEVSRAKKEIGHSLNAKVTLYAQDANYDFLKSVESELQTVFIVSGIEVVKGEAPENATAGESYPKVGIQVSASEGYKCERCWTYSETVGSSEQHPTLCSRCQEAIK